MPGEAAEFLLALGDACTPNAIKIAGSVETMSAAQIKAVSTTLRLDAAIAKGQSARARAAADMARANAAMQKSGQTADDTGSAAQNLTGQLEGLGGEAASLGGPLGKLQGLLAGLGPYGQAAAVALGVLTIGITATIGVLVALMAKIIDVNDELDDFSTRLDALTGSASGGADVLDMVRRVGDELRISNKLVGDWAESLTRAGLRGKDLESAMRAVAAASALNPKGGAEAAEGFLAKLAKSGKEAEGIIKGVAEQSKKGTGPLRDMGLELADLGGEAAVAAMSAAQLSKKISDVLQQKGAGALAGNMADWPNIIGKAKEGFDSLFEGLSKPAGEFMEAVKSLFGEFDRGKTTMGGLRGVTTGFFTTVFSWATKATNMIHKGFLYVAIWVLTAYIAMRPLIERLKQLGASASFIAGLKMVLLGIAIQFAALVAPVLLAIVVISAIVLTVAALTAALVYVIGVVVNFAASVVEAFMIAYKGARAAGGSFVDGIVAGIVGGVDKVVGAVKGLASSALEAFTSTFGIKSPSTVMRKHGQKNIAEDGLAEGIDRGAPVVADAMARLGGEPANVNAGVGRGQGGASGGERHYHFHYTGPADQADTFFEQAQRWLETLDGEAPPPAVAA